MGRTRGEPDESGLTPMGVERLVTRTQSGGRARQNVVGLREGAAAKL